MSIMKVSFTLNGKKVSVSVPSETLLVDLLRDELGLTGTKVGCREGECGACTVLIDGDPFNSCLMPAFKVSGREVTTIEGLEKEDGTLDILQQAFMAEGAAQCGFCTPGMILNAKALLDKNPDPDEGEIRQALSGVLCLGSSLAALGGVLYAPLSTLDPYMGFHILILCFAVVIVGGMGNFKGTALAAYVLGMVMAITGRYWGAASDAMVYVVMAFVLAFRPIKL